MEFFNLDNAKMHVTIFFLKVNKNYSSPFSCNNPCPNLELINGHGKWKCVPHKGLKSCENERTGDVCHLNCNKQLRALKGNTTVCTTEGWVPSHESLRWVFLPCYYPCTKTKEYYKFKWSETSNFSHWFEPVFLAFHWSINCI